MRSPSKIAVVGAGISGLSAAWLLSRAHDVTLFEREPRPGGHSNTIDVPSRSGSVPIDTGFIVYNAACYPNLVALLAHLGVATAESDMSFSVSLDRGACEYSGSGPRGLFGQASNVLRPSHWRMLADIPRFFREVRELLATAPGTRSTLGAFLAERRYSPAFTDRHILPMAGAIWSCPPAAMLDFPVVSFGRFFANHGLLQIRNRPRWRTVAGGSRCYVDALLRDFRGTLALGTGIGRIERDAEGVTVRERSGHAARFDACVIAAHADEALAMLAAPAALEHELLSAFAYQANHAVLHTDEASMPRRRRLWSSWNFIADGASSAAAPCVTYWMNRLQPLGATENYFVTLNAARPIDERSIRASLVYRHPVFGQRALDAQTRLSELQGRQRTWFCGSYFGYGFHEDGLRSGLAAAEAIGRVRRPWAATDGHDGTAGLDQRPSRTERETAG